MLRGLYTNWIARSEKNKNTWDEKEDDDCDKNKTKMIINDSSNSSGSWRVKVAGLSSEMPGFQIWTLHVLYLVEMWFLDDCLSD
jgi:hypothetical protein